MNTGTTSKFTAIAVACLSLGMYALAQKAGGPTSGGHAGGEAMQQSTQNQSASMPQQNAPPSQNPNMNTTKMNASSTPRGHHFGWQKGRHNPHRVSPNPSVAASVAGKTDPNPTANPKDTSPPPLQSP